MRDGKNEEFLTHSTERKNVENKAKLKNRIITSVAISRRDIKCLCVSLTPGRKV